VPRETSSEQQVCDIRFEADIPKYKVGF